MITPEEAKKYLASGAFIGLVVENAFKTIIAQAAEIERLKECLKDGVGILENSGCSTCIHKEVKEVMWLDEARELLGVEHE